MGIFDHIANQQKQDVEATWWEVVGWRRDGDKPVAELHVRSTGRSNKRYQQVALETSGRGFRRGGKDKIGALNRAREVNRKVFSKTIVIGWKNVFDGEGRPVPFPPLVDGYPDKEGAALVYEFLKAIGDDAFDSLQIFCGDVDQFREDDEEDDGHLEEADQVPLAKPSPPATRGTGV